MNRSGDLDASTGGIDFTLRWDQNRGSWTGIAAGTHAPISGVLENGSAVLTNGRLRRHVLSLTGHATYAFSRDMTLEAYLQPFVAVGDYTDIRRLARARSFDFESVVLGDNPDFNTKSMRSNVVFRWEYQKGSTFFLVWNLSTLDDTRAGRFALGRDLGDAFTGPGSHVFIAKFSYGLGL